MLTGAARDAEGVIPASAPWARVRNDGLMRAAAKGGAGQLSMVATHKIPDQPERRSDAQTFLSGTQKYRQEMDAAHSGLKNCT